MDALFLPECHSLTVSTCKGFRDMVSACRDKDYPNGANTYMRVVKSIVSAINDDEITEHFQLAYKLAQDKYKKDILALQHALRR